MKKITIKSGADPLLKKVDLLGNMFFGGFSPVETKVFLAVFSIGKNAPVNITPNISNSITKELNLSDNTLNVSLSRLDSKGAISKNKRIVTLHPVFKDVDKENDFLIKFVADESNRD